MVMVKTYSISFCKYICWHRKSQIYEINRSYCGYFVTAMQWHTKVDRGGPRCSTVLAGKGAMPQPQKHPLAEISKQRISLNLRQRLHHLHPSELIQTKNSLRPSPNEKNIVRIVQRMISWKRCKGCPVLHLKCVTTTCFSKRTLTPMEGNFLHMAKKDQKRWLLPCCQLS